jgi:hypothetical protein
MKLSVVIPARDEEATIAATVRDVVKPSSRRASTTRCS